MIAHLTRLVALAALVLAPVRASAQADGPPRGQMLRGRIEVAFLDQVTRQLALTPAQRVGVERVLNDWGTRRRTLETEERGLTMALAGQLRPGVAANPDSVTRVVDRLLANRVGYAESFQGEMRDLTPILTPAQRGQFVMMRDQIFRRIRELQDRRPGQSAPAREPRNSP